MKRSPSLVAATLGFSIGAIGLAAAFVVVVATAIARSGTSHGIPTSTDYRFGAAALLLLVTGFFVSVVAARRSALPMPSARAGFFAGVAGATVLLAVMMLVGKPLGMHGPLVVALVAGMVSAAGVMRVTRARPAATIG